MGGRDPIVFVDRESGESREETVVYGGNALHWMYGNPLGKAITGLFLKRRPFSAFYGLTRRGVDSVAAIEPFVQNLGIDMEEAERPVGAYRSFNDFFTRRLKPEARPVIADPEILITPADGRTLVVPKIASDTVVPVKGRRWEIPRLVGGRRRARAWENGSAVVVRLAPQDYHRFHFPDGGMPGPARRIGGFYHSVNPIAIASGADIFCTNERQVTVLESDGFGRIGIVEIGAMLVGTIRQTFAPGERVERGAEKGFFEFGGSTLVLLLEPGRVTFDDDLVRRSGGGIEVFCKMGTRIGRIQGH